MTVLLNAVTSDQSSGVVKNHNELISVFAWGTFAGVTVKLQISPDKSEWFDLADATFTAKGTINLQIPDGVYYRANVSGTGSPAPAVSLAVVGFKL